MTLAYWPSGQLLQVWPVMGSLHFVPQVQTPGIGVISVSKGAEIGLAMACFLKQVVATVCINGSTAICEFPLRYKDLVIAPIPTFMERLQFDISGAVRLLHYRGDPRDKVNQRSVLPVEKAQGSILFIVGENDECSKSREYAEQALHQLQNHGRNNGRMLVYPGAGHLIEPPYAPLCYASPNLKLSSPLLWGGEPTAHATAQEHSWGEILKFFRQHLIQARSKLWARAQGDDEVGRQKNKTKAGIGWEEEVLLTSLGSQFSWISCYEVGQKSRANGTRSIIWQICMEFELFVNWILVSMHQGTLLSQNCDALANWIIFCFPR